VVYHEVYILMTGNTGKVLSSYSPRWTRCTRRVWQWSSISAASCLQYVSHCSSFCVLKWNHC